MSLSVEIDGGGKEFEAVTEMIQPGVIADIVDKGMVDNKFKPGTQQHKCYFVWIVAEEDTGGRNKRVFQSFTVSLNEKSSLRKFLGTLGYKEFAAGTPFVLDSLIGTKRMLVLSQEDSAEKGGKPFLKITATMALKHGQKGVDVPADFVRKQDQPAKG